VSKAERIERIKREKNPWEHRDEILEFARNGYASIPQEWLAVHFPLWGTYTQGDGRGVRGKAIERFMLRVRIPNGLLQSVQLRALARLADRFGGGIADLTVRQNVQLHWVRVEDMPEILETLSRVNLTTAGTCGDDTRNITGCPLAGFDSEEILDASPLVREATDALVGNAEFYNLPRKFKISITGCRSWCSYPEINDVGLTAVEREDGVKGFSLRVGGGLSTHPHFGVRLNAFVLPAQVVPVVRGIAAIFRDADVLRQDRSKARLKFLFLDHGWTAHSFQEELERRIGFSLAPAVAEELPGAEGRDHLGIRPQKQKGLYYAGLPVLRGRLTASQMSFIADMADRYGDGQLRTTAMQNIVVVNVPQAAVEALTYRTSNAGMPLDVSPFRRGAVACTGTEFCKLAIAETKSFARWLVEELEERVPGFEQSLRINVNGCPNACGQHWIADIGLQGCQMKADGRTVEGFDVLLGGGVGRDAAFTRRVGFRAPAAEIPEALARLLGRLGHESFIAFVRRHSDAELRSLLAGAEVDQDVEEAAAPAWPGPPPHGVEG